MEKTTRLFVACIVALMTTSAGFIVRAFLLTEWGARFNLTESQMGSLSGAGLFPFALSIIFFSLIVDRIGYGRTMAFAWVGHMLSAIITVTAESYAGLYVGTLLFALANGAVEAVINPVTATLYPKNKTHYLNILHAGWPAGLVLGGVLAIALGGLEGPDAWRWKVGLFLLPTVVYGAMLLGLKFPVQERVAAGVPYREMLGEFGWAGCLIVMAFVAMAVDEVLAGLAGISLSTPWLVALTLLPTLLFALQVRRFGRPVFVLLLVVMVLLATTELGTDSWIAALMTPVLKDLGANAGNWVLIYTSALMVVLRFFAGPIAHRLSPLGLLAACSALAAIGLYWLGHAASGLMIFAAATCYGVGKTFFWPTTLGVVSEQFPKGGALTLNAIAGLGMISVGVLGIPLLGTLQDRAMDQTLRREQPALHATVAEAPQSKYGLSFQPLDKARLASLPATAQAEIESVRVKNNRDLLRQVAVLPIVMLLCYLGLIAYYAARGGYRPVELETAAAKGETGRQAAHA